MTTSDPTVPLKYAEMLYVAMATMVDVLKNHELYPTKNLEVVLEAYRRSALSSLHQQGFTTKDSMLFRAAAADALSQWLEEKARAEEESSKDFDLWTLEMDGNE